MYGFVTLDGAFWCIISLKCGVWFMRRDIEVYYQDYFSLVAIMELGRVIVYADRCLAEQRLVEKSLSLWTFSWCEVEII